MKKIITRRHAQVKTQNHQNMEKSSKEQYAVKIIEQVFKKAGKTLSKSRKVDKTYKQVVKQVEQVIRKSNKFSNKHQSIKTEKKKREKLS